MGHCYLGNSATAISVMKHGSKSGIARKASIYLLGGWCIVRGVAAIGWAVVGLGAVNVLGTFNNDP